MKHLFKDAMPHLELRDYLYLLPLDFDIDAQLMAIRGLLHRSRRADEELKDEIKKIEEHNRRLKGIHAEWAVDDWVDHVHHSGYQGAAHSMAAVGMLAPLVETIFYQCFRGIEKRFYSASRPKSTHVRWKTAPTKQWDCHFFVEGNRWDKGIVRGIFQLSDALGLASKLPPGLEPMLAALFDYRNNMFHNGLEWPQDERVRFAKRIEDKGWPHEWFPRATTGNAPWIFYLSEGFIEHCLSTIDQVLNTFGSFIRDDLLESPVN